MVAESFWNSTHPELNLEVLRRLVLPTIAECCHYARGR